MLDHFQKFFLLHKLRPQTQSAITTRIHFKFPHDRILPPKNNRPLHHRNLLTKLELHHFSFARILKIRRRMQSNHTRPMIKFHHPLPKKCRPNHPIPPPPRFIALRRNRCHPPRRIFRISKINHQPAISRRPLFTRDPNNPLRPRRLHLQFINHLRMQCRHGAR